ncbi:MAG: photosystem I reaction center subunit IV [Burkholderiales bacterium]|nr:photosystem I reaction center subunit IV [Burkholderiales bacterium]
MLKFPLCATALLALAVAPLIAFADDAASPAAAAASAAAYAPSFVPTHADRMILLDVERAGQRLVAVGERGVVFLSGDEGKTWQAQRTAVTRTLTMAAFADANNGIAVGHDATVLRTSDAGSHWTRVVVPDAGSDSLLGVTWLGEQRYVAYGGFGLYIETRDGGQTWTRHKILEPDFDRHISRVFAAGAHRYVLVGESATLAVSDDAVNWKRIESPYKGSWFGGLATKSGAIVIYGMRGHVCRSEDGGASWTVIDIADERSVMNAQQLADGRIVLVGYAGLLDVSRDDGRSYQRLKGPLRAGIAQVQALADGRLLTVGDRGARTVTP